MISKNIDDADVPANWEPISHKIHYIQSEKSKFANVSTHILHISVCHLDARMKRWISVYIPTLMEISQNFQNPKSEN